MIVSRANGASQLRRPLDTTRLACGPRFQEIVLSSLDRTGLDQRRGAGAESGGYDRGSMPGHRRRNGKGDRAGEAQGWPEAHRPDLVPAHDPADLAVQVIVDRQAGTIILRLDMYLGIGSAPIESTIHHWRSDHHQEVEEERGQGGQSMRSRTELAQPTIEFGGNTAPQNHAVMALPGLGDSIYQLMSRNVSPSAGTVKPRVSSAPAAKGARRGQSWK